MGRFVYRRCAGALVVLVGVTILTFFISHVIPGDPAVTWAGPRASPQQVAQVTKQLGLDRPLWAQLWTYAANLVEGDWGTSLNTRQPVLHDLAQRLPVSLELVIASIVIALFIGVPLGALAARFKGSVIDHIIRLLTVVWVSVPIFWLGMMGQLLFSQKLRLVPVAGEFNQSLLEAHPVAHVTGIVWLDSLLTSNWSIFWDGLWHLLLPALALASFPIGLVARMVRAKELEVIGETHINMVRALGFSERSVYGRFALRLSWNPVLQVLALVFAQSLVNTFLIEQIFSWPGIGSYIAESIISLDTPAIMGTTLLIALFFVGANFAVDLLQAAFDPRVRLR